MSDSNLEDDLLVHKVEALTSSTDNAEISPSPSSKLKLMLEAANTAFGHAKEAILSAYHQALSEGFSPFQAKQLLFSNIKTVGQRTIYLYLPDEAKDKEKQRNAKSPLQDCSDTPDKKPKPQPRQTSSEEKNPNWPSGKNNSAGTLILGTELADIIHDCVHSDKSNGYQYRFLLTHDGQNVSSVKDFDSQDVLTSSTSSILNPDGANLQSKDLPLYPERSEFKPIINEINDASIECPDCKIRIQKIQELEEALEACSGPTTAEIQLTARSQEKKEFVIPLDIEESLDYIETSTIWRFVQNNLDYRLHGDRHWKVNFCLFRRTV